MPQNMHKNKYDFFLVIPRGFEDIAVLEIQRLKSHLEQVDEVDIQKTKGGVELKAGIEFIIIAHYHLKIPTRILMRLIEFKFKDLPSLYNNLKKISWKKYLTQNKLSFEISSKNCRINHSKRVEDTLVDFFNKNRDAQTNENTQKIYLRGNENNWLLSLDLTGEQLWKRKTNNSQGLAPIKENLAAGILNIILYDLKLDHFENHALIDPCAGSGTFLEEAQNLFIPRRKETYFTFKDIPLIKGSLYLAKNNIQKIYESKTWDKIIGYDLNPVPELDIQQRDLFQRSKTPVEVTDQNRNIIILSNLPYGLRVTLERPISEYIVQITNIYKRAQYYFVINKDHRKDLDHSEFLKSYNIIDLLEFKNGNIPVLLVKLALKNH